MFLFISTSLMSTNIWCFFCLLFVFVLCVFLIGKMAPQVTINFHELPVTIVVKRRMLTARRNIQMVFTIGPHSILAEFSLSNSMEPLWGLERANKPAPMTDKPLTKKSVNNLKRNKRRSDKRCAKSSTSHEAGFNQERNRNKGNIGKPRYNCTEASSGLCLSP